MKEKSFPCPFVQNLFSLNFYTHLHTHSLTVLCIHDSIRVFLILIEIKHMAVFQGGEDDLQLKSFQVDYTRHLISIDYMLTLFLGKIFLSLRFLLLYLLLPWYAYCTYRVSKVYELNECGQIQMGDRFQICFIIVIKKISKARACKVEG